MSTMLARCALILHVEDEAGFHELLELSFEEAGVDVEIAWAREGTEALAWLRAPENKWPDLCLLDLKMPTMDGLEFLRRVRADPCLARLHVVILTTSTDEVDLLAAAGLDVDRNHFLQKPPRFDELVALMERLGHCLARRLGGGTQSVGDDAVTPRDVL